MPDKIRIGFAEETQSFTLPNGRHELGRDITVQAESSAEARRTVMEIIPGAVVTGVHRIRK